MAGDYEGRRPSYDAEGKVRAFRTKPGAPQADPTRNIGSRELGSTLPGVTPMSNWNRIFTNSLTGNNPLAKKPAGASSLLGMSIPTTEDDELFGFGSPKPSTPPSLETMAAGGPDHAQRWSQPSSSRWTGGMLSKADQRSGFQTGNPSDILKKYQTKGTTATYNGFGWGSAFT